MNVIKLKMSIKSNIKIKLKKSINQIPGAVCKCTAIARYYFWQDKTISREPDFFKTIYQRHDETQDSNTLKTFAFPIINAKKWRK